MSWDPWGSMSVVCDARGGGRVKVVVVMYESGRVEEKVYVG